MKRSPKMLCALLLSLLLLVSALPLSAGAAENTEQYLIPEEFSALAAYAGIAYVSTPQQLNDAIENPTTGIIYIVGDIRFTPETLRSYEISKDLVFYVCAARKGHVQ